MATAGDIINGALRLIGQLAEGEAPSSETAADCLQAMNQMIDSWNTESLSVYTNLTQQFTWPSAQAVRTLGPTGNFVGVRPVMLSDSTYFVDPGNGISYGVAQVSEEQFNSITLKTATSPYPQVMKIDADFPNITMSVFPVPSKALTWFFVSPREIVQAALLDTELANPPGYLRAFRYNLACEIAPEFGVEPSPQVQRIAMTAKRDLKRINFSKDVMSMPDEMGAGTPRFNIYSGSH